jgi:hypothetical protein
MIQIDLYTENYMGELETTLIEKNNSNQIIFELRMFSADFSSIVNWIPFDTNSHNESLVYLYNMDMDFADDFTEIKRLQEFYNQLLSISNQVQPHPLGIADLDSLKQICLSTLQNENRLFIKHNH